MITAHDVYIAELQQTRVAPVLHHLSGELLTADELADVERFTALANTAEDTALAFKQQRAGLARQRAVELIDAGTVDTDALTAAALELAHIEDVELIAHNAYAVATTKARALTFARAGSAARIISERYAGIAAEVDNLTPALANVKTAQQAIETGKTAEWQKVSELQVNYNALSELVAELRRSGKLPKASHSGQQGAHWTYRLPVSPFAFKQAQDANDDGRAAFLLSIRREPWVPATAAEAEKVRRDWANGKTAEVTS